MASGAEMAGRERRSRTIGSMLCALVLLNLSACLPDRKPQDSAQPSDAASKQADAGARATADTTAVADQTSAPSAVDAGPLKGCSTDDQCTALVSNPCQIASCDLASRQCKVSKRPDGHVCGKDDKCKKGHQCKAGYCGHQAMLCDDGSPCTSDGCAPATGCTFSPVSGVCNDGNPCTDVDECNAGVCTGKTTQTIEVLCGSDSDPCLVFSCSKEAGCQKVPAELAKAATVTCDDENKCIKTDVCSKGKCAGVAIDCPDTDKNFCTIAGCLPAKGCMTEVGIVGMVCDDGDPCTGEDVCAVKSGANPMAAGAVSCQGPTKSCDDDNPCSKDVCDKTKGCQHAAAPDGALCSDSKACSGQGTCSAGKCTGIAAKSCDDGNVCSDDSCDAAKGGCVHLPAKATCDDGNACTEDDACSQGLCTATLNCDDNNPCTDTPCDAAKGCQLLYKAKASGCPGGGQCWAGGCQVAKCGNGDCDFNETTKGCAGDCPAGGGQCAQDKGLCIESCESSTCKTELASCNQDTGCAAVRNAFESCKDVACHLLAIGKQEHTAVAKFANLHACVQKKCVQNAWSGQVCVGLPEEVTCTTACVDGACYLENVQCQGSAACATLDSCLAQCTPAGDPKCKDAQTKCLDAATSKNPKAVDVQAKLSVCRNGKCL